MRYVAIVPEQGGGLSRARPDAVRDRGVAARARPNIEWRGVPFVTGLLTTVIQLLTGVGGLFLDIFFQKSMLDRKTTIATKAVTQTFSHVVRAVYFGSFVGHRRCGAALDLPGRRSCSSIAGTSLAPLRARAHDRPRLPPMDAGVIFAISSIYLVRAAWLFWHAS